jgi:hypothetical protein
MHACGGHFCCRRRLDRRCLICFGSWIDRPRGAEKLNRIYNNISRHRNRNYCVQEQIPLHHAGNRITVADIMSVLQLLPVYIYGVYMYTQTTDADRDATGL